MKDDVNPNFRFYVEIDEKKQAVFTEVSGLQIETVVQEYEEGGNNGYVHRLPGRTKVSNLTLKRGITRSNEFFKWQAEIASGKITRRNISLVIYDVKGDVLIRWEFIKAYPVKWIGPQLSADGHAMAIETLELAHDGVKLG
ncbi:MAG: phage tail protein [Kouleothrix sp.]|nr:phage tail protein [Kouleothrix sp.]